MLKYILFFFVYACIFSCSNGHKKITVLNENGIKKEIETIDYGSGGGLTGSAPSLTKQTIKKYNLQNKIFYFSKKEIHRDGCFYSNPIWQISTTDSTGVTKEFTVKENLVIVKITDANNKVIEETTQDRSKFIIPDWFDKEERIHY